MSKYQDKTREELIQELEDLQKSYDGVMKTLGLSTKVLNLNNLRDYQSRMRFLMNAVHIAWWEIDIKDDSVIFDQKKAEMLGFPPEKFKKYQDFTQLLHPDDYEKAMQAMKDHLTGKLDCYDTEYRILSASGKYIWFRDVGSIVKLHSDGTPEKVAGIVIDMSERKKAEEELKSIMYQLQKTNAEKDKFLSIIAHDLRSPLNSFLGFTDLLMGDVDNMSPKDIRAMAKLMNSSAYNLYRLLDNLLEWSRMKRGVTFVEPQFLQLSEEIKDAVNFFAATAIQKQIKISVDMDEMISVYADPNMLKSILRNLVNNALKFTNRGGLVQINAYIDKNGDVVTLVKDNGIGMEHVMLDNLFRLDVNTKRHGTENEPTTGLGLILCKDFIETNGGKIWVTSEVGKGSSFYFSLPSSSESKKI